MLMYLFRTFQWRELAYRIMHESGPHWIARHLPRRVVYWCTIVLWANATSGRWERESVTDVTVPDALKRWGVE